jgi:hypothetical protein
LCYSTKEEKFYDNIKDKISYSILTKKGILRRIFFKEYKKNFKLNIEQKEALIGIMLGDGYLERNKSTHNTSPLASLIKRRGVIDWNVSFRDIPN